MATKQWIRTAKRLRIYKRDRFRCVWCTREVRITNDQAPDMATLDHVLPRALGGCNAAYNLITSCQACNCERGKRPALEYAFYVEAERGRNGWMAWQLLNRVISAVCAVLPP